MPMFSFDIYLSGLVVMVIAVLLVWLLSLRMRNVSIVDSAWGPLFALGAFTYAADTLIAEKPRAIGALIMVSVWALRLSGYITWRNWGHAEDARYREIRARNQPNFEFKSLYLVFLLQALLAWLISLPLLGAILSSAPLHPLDYCGVALWIIGMVFEGGGDWQLARFKADPANRGAVMDRGLWRYTRHPNLLRRFLRVVGSVFTRRGCRCLVEHPGPAPHVLAVDPRIGCDLARKRHWPAATEVCRLHPPHQCFFPGTTEELN